ncbi:MAG: hypothetical protein ABIP93_06945 [Gemmatimonadaceae bacterium]
MMQHRIFAVLLACTLSLQLVLAGVGVTCLAPSGADAGSRAADGMAGMSGMEMSDPAGQGVATGDAASAPQKQRSSSIPCERAPASANCQLFASCAAGFVVADPAIGVAPQPSPSTVRVIELLTPTSRTIVPELPPPRA